jgi:hypothetical protein
MAKQLLDSKVDRVSLSIYHATPAELGTFDFVFAGSCVMHLRDQLLALERIAGLCTGTFVSADEYDRVSGLMPIPTSRFLADREQNVVFWLPSKRTWRRMIWTAGFDRVEEHAKFRLYTPDRKFYVRHVVHHASR